MIFSIYCIAVIKILPTPALVVYKVIFLKVTNVNVQSIFVKYFKTGHCPNLLGLTFKAKKDRNTGPLRVVSECPIITTSDECRGKNVFSNREIL
jgi:hypothetical protein